MVEVVRFPNFVPSGAAGFEPAILCSLVNRFTNYGLARGVVFQNILALSSLLYHKTFSISNLQKCTDLVVS
jgi:hypothetical protein